MIKTITLMSDISDEFGILLFRQNMNWFYDHKNIYSTVQPNMAGGHIKQWIGYNHSQPAPMAVIPETLPPMKVGDKFTLTVVSTCKFRYEMDNVRPDFKFQPSYYPGTILQFTVMKAYDGQEILDFYTQQVVVPIIL